MKTAAVHRLNPQRLGPKAALLLAAAALTVLAGCKTGPHKGVAGWMFADPSVRFPIAVNEREVALDLRVQRGAPGLTRVQIGDTLDFVASYKKESKGPLLVRAPSGTPNEVASMRALDDIRHALRREGVPGDAVQFESYYGGGDPQAPLRLAYSRYVAYGPECGNWPSNVGRDPQNVPYENFGCSAQRNLAAMVADPRDLIEPRGMTPRSSERRDTIWKKWVAGEPTGATRTDEEKADVSEVQGAGG